MLAAQLNGNFAIGRMTATNIWNMAFGMYQVEDRSIVHHSMMYVESPWSGESSINPPMQVVAHWTAFTRPGWRYLNLGDSAVLPGGAGTATALTNGTDLTVVIETMNATALQDVSIRFKGGSLPKTLHHWQTTEGKLFTKQPDVAVPGPDGSWLATISMRPETIVTLSTVATAELPVPSAKQGACRRRLKPPARGQ